ncbi:hypothetical protein [Streptomyces sp. NPDC047061]|uniref:hypothetical protein n=1 Tax=Streptomyces sp. NPDC047061 TaxID=3154605 RepID=UPI0033F29169
MSTTLGAPAPDQAAYMLRAAASAAGRGYKQELLDLLDVQPGQTVLDVGCGPGTDLPTLAERVGGRGTVDRAKIDRVLRHVTDPAVVLEQLRLATRRGARIGLAEPDWDTLVVDAEDLGTSRAFTRYTTSEVVRHATIGRSLARCAERAGFVTVICSG